MPRRARIIAAFLACIPVAGFVYDVTHPTPLPNPQPQVAYGGDNGFFLLNPPEDCRWIARYENGPPFFVAAHPRNPQQGYFVPANANTRFVTVWYESISKPGLISQGLVINLGFHVPPTPGAQPSGPAPLPPTSGPAEKEA